jgi:D-alanine-D-alanine ligase-like ATP-grasp enzyme
MVRIKVGVALRPFAGSPPARLFEGWVRAAAMSNGVRVDSLSDGWILRLSRGGQVRHTYGYRFDINPSAAGLAAQDKAATHAVLAHVGVPSVPHQLLRCGGYADLSAVVAGACRFGFPCVLKPNPGSGGRGVRLVESQREMARLIRRMRPGETWTVSPYVAIEAEYRVVVLDGRNLVAYRKIPHRQMDGLAANTRLVRHNLAQGCPPDLIEPALLPALRRLAASCSRALALRLAAVDIVQDGGRLRVLEVNDGIMMEHYGRASARNRRRAAGVYAAILAAMFTSDQVVAQPLISGLPTASGGSPPSAF